MLFRHFPSQLALLVHGDALSPQLRLRLLDLCHQFLVRLGDIIEGEDTPSKLEKEVCAERHQCPKRELGTMLASTHLCLRWMEDIHMARHRSGLSLGRERSPGRARCRTAALLAWSPLWGIYEVRHTEKRTTKMVIVCVAFVILMWVEVYQEKLNAIAKVGSRPGDLHNVAFRARIGVRGLLGDISDCLCSQNELSTRINKVQHDGQLGCSPLGFSLLTS